MAHPPGLARLRPRLSTLLIAFAAARLANPLRASRSHLRKLANALALLLAILNWRAIPFYWHCMTLWPVLLIKFRRWSLGSIDALVAHQQIIGRPPFDARIISNHSATWNSCDFMLHLSNSSYAVALDEARSLWHLNILGPTMRSDLEYIRPYVASTHFTFFAEIPLLADFQVEVRPVSWDSKWVYLLAIFTTSPPNGSSSRTVNCLSITRTVNKIGRRTVPPAKLFAACGFGKDHSNWTTISNLRRQQRPKGKDLTPAQDWLLNGEPIPDDLMGDFEEKRQFNLDIVRSGLDGINGAERLKEL